MSTPHRLLISFLWITFCLVLACAPRVVQPPPKPAKIALVLGAGASRGFAHIGVLKALEAHGVPVHMIVGTSAGSFVGSLYAYGYTAFELQKLSFSIEKEDIIDFGVPDRGFIKGDKLEEYINKKVQNTPLERLRTPFYAVATDIQTGEEVTFGKGGTGGAVRASCAIPGVFRPYKLGDRYFVDGGVVSPVPVEAARKLGADVIIAVDISASAGSAAPETTIETLLQSINLMYARLAAVQLLKAEVVIRPAVGHIGSSDFTKRHEAVLEGEKAALAALPRITALLDTLRRQGRLR
jgi:NTE family protein